MGILVKLVGSGIGLAREAYERNKRSKSPSGRDAIDVVAGSSTASHEQANDPPPEYVDLPEDEASHLIAAGKAVPVDGKSKLSPADAATHRGDDLSDNEEDEDEEEILWELDEAAELADPPSYEESEATKGAEDDLEHEKKLVRQILEKAGPVPSTVSKLELPIVIPQRRPRSKGRGFVHAYPPVLQESGINQDTFLTFITNFSKSAQPNKALLAVFVAAQIVGFVPDVTAMIVSLAISIPTGAAIEIEKRYKANSYLNEVNEKLFKPRGKYAVIISFKPNQERPVDFGEFDPNRVIAQYSESSGSKFRDGARNLRVSSAKVYSDLDIGETAPLVFPTLDEAAADPKSNKFRRANDFLQEYYDRRAQANYNASHPGSALSTQSVQFASRYSDPNHPASSGSLIALLTGGHVNPHRRKQDRRNAKRIARGKQPRNRDEPRGRIKRMIREDVIYLLIVNMPTEQELAVARRELEAMKQQKAQSSLFNLGRGQ